MQMTAEKNGTQPVCDTSLEALRTQVPIHFECDSRQTTTNLPLCSERNQHLFEYSTAQMVTQPSYLHISVQYQANEINPLFSATQAPLERG